MVAGRTGLTLLSRGIQESTDGEKRMNDVAGDLRPRISPQMADRLDRADMRRRLKAIFIGSIGNLVEWYDFFAYAAFSLYFPRSFFPGRDPILPRADRGVLLPSV